MVIKPLPREFNQRAVALWHEAGLTRPWNDPESDQQRATAGANSTVLAAFEGDQLLGTVMVGDDGHRGWVYYLAVASTAQGQGIGRTLMDASEAWLLARGCVKLNLMVRSTNSTVLGFYGALGYSDDQVTVLSKRLVQA